MAKLVHTDSVVRVEPGTTPNYDQDNPLQRLLRIVEETRLAAAREAYDVTSLQYLFPLTWLQTYGPSSPNSDQLDPTQQDTKTDFQKQNVRDFHLGDTCRPGLGRARATAGPVPAPQLPGRPGLVALRRGGRAGRRHRLHLFGAGGCSDHGDGAVRCRERALCHQALGPLRRRSARLRRRSGVAAIDAGRLQGRSDLEFGSGDEFDRVAVDRRDLREVAPRHLMHPVLPLYVDVRWSAAADGSGASDPPSGTTRLGFEMQLRGWNAYLGVGTSGNPHGGVGFAEFRNLFSNYWGYAGSGELARRLEPWNLDALGNKGHRSGDLEPFMAVDYMDLHALEAGCGIGLHRHRDNQEAFFMLDGEGTMIVGDWADSGTRHRCFEVRSLRAGHLAMLRGGNLHALMNPTDRRALLFMFGGYD